MTTQVDETIPKGVNQGSRFHGPAPIDRRPGELLLPGQRRADKAREHAHVRPPLRFPIKDGGGAGPGGKCHPDPGLLVVQQHRDGLRKACDIPGCHVDSGVPGRDPGLLQVESNDRQGECLYSMVLFIVETSLSGLSGSGEIPISALERYSLIIRASARPVNVT